MESEKLIEFLRSIYGTKIVPLYKPSCDSVQLDKINEVLISGEISTASSFVDELADKLSKVSGSSYVIPTNSGTSALHMSLISAGITPGDIVIMPALTFVATGNAVLYSGAVPYFLDVDESTLGINPELVRSFIDDECDIRNDSCYHIKSGKRVGACIPVHVLGNPCKIEQITSILSSVNIPVIEDAAESFGSEVNGKMTGSFGDLGCLSFNGNKVITSGAGGAILTSSREKADFLTHITTTAKVSHLYEFYHDQLGFNNKMAGLNAGLLIGQLNKLDSILSAKRKLADQVKQFCNENAIEMLWPENGQISNHWLNAVIVENKQEREKVLTDLNDVGIGARPLWKPLIELPHFAGYESWGLETTNKMVDRVICLPSYLPQKPD